MDEGPNGGMDECRLRRDIGNAQEISRKLSGNFILVVLAVLVVLVIKKLCFFSSSSLGKAQTSLALLSLIRQFSNHFSAKSPKSQVLSLL